ncbi:MAG: hypothetical protein RJA25_2070, partial [Bacteroidota bacterium]
MSNETLNDNFAKPMLYDVFFYAVIGLTLICPPTAFKTFIIVENCGFAPS